jgi:L-ribulokinase
MEASICDVLAESDIDPAEVVGLGVDFTSCTILPTKSEGTPLSSIPTLRSNPHAWAKLWRHHAAWKQAARINEVAAARHEPWLPRYGGAIYSEWVIPKALQILEESPDTYRAADRIIEGADWIVWQLTGRLVRNSCGAGYKAQWHKKEGFPSSEYLKALNPLLGDLYIQKLAGPVQPPGTLAGGLTLQWAKRLGLKEGTPVATGIIDAHGAALGGGVTGPGIMFLIMGTSTCHMLMSDKEVLVKGISGVVQDGIMPGLFGYEAGQASVGDILAWFVENSVTSAHREEADRQKRSLHDVLTDKASVLYPGQNGLLALDWWNGNRCTLGDADLSGLVVGYTLTTKPEEIYRALIEATAFGTRVIIEAFTRQGVPVERVMAGGGLTKNACLMQIYADILGYDIAVSGTEYASALGAAILGAVAAGKQASAYNSIPEAVSHIAPPPARTYHPIPRYVEIYDILYKEYLRLYNYFGRSNKSMKVLRRLRNGEVELAISEAGEHGGND